MFVLPRLLNMSNKLIATTGAMLTISLPQVQGQNSLKCPTDSLASGQTSLSASRTALSYITFSR